MDALEAIVEATERLKVMPSSGPRVAHLKECARIIALYDELERGSLCPSAGAARPMIPAGP